MSAVSRSAPKVALLIETAHGYGRGLLRGIVRYARLHGPWGFYVTPGDFEQFLPKMRQWGGTGIIARIETEKVAAAILESGLPTIALDLSEKQLESGSPMRQFGEIASDSQAAGKMAAEYLLERGFQHYAFVGIGDRVWSQRRQVSFSKRIAEAGFEALVYKSPRRRRDSDWYREQAVLRQWLAELPKPVGLMACNDARGREVLEACREGGLAVPEEIAVLGVDNDELLCELSDPPLSSVALNALGGGFEAAALLDRMMRRRVRKPRRLLVEPLHVVSRQSTDIMALEDREVGEALRFIHDNMAATIGVDDVAEAVQMSRRTLEIRFQQVISRTIHAEIQRVRLERAQRLLLESNLAMPQVAAAAGYGSAAYLSQVFRKELGITPVQYRRQKRRE